MRAKRKERSGVEGKRKQVTSKFETPDNYVFCVCVHACVSPASSVLRVYKPVTSPPGRKPPQVPKPDRISCADIQYGAQSRLNFCGGQGEGLECTEITSKSLCSFSLWNIKAEILK